MIVDMFVETGGDPFTKKMWGIGIDQHNNLVRFDSSIRVPLNMVRQPDVTLRNVLVLSDEMNIKERIADMKSRGLTFFGSYSLGMEDARKCQLISGDEHVARLVATFKKPYWLSLMAGLESASEANEPKLGASLLYPEREGTALLEGWSL